MKRRWNDVFHHDEEKKIEKTNTKTRLKRVFSPLRRRVLSSLCSISLRVLFCATLSLSLSVCLLFFCASKNLFFVRSSFGCFLAAFSVFLLVGWLFENRERKEVLDRTFIHITITFVSSFRLFIHRIHRYYVRFIISGTRSFSSKVFFESEKRWEEIFLLFFLILIREESQSMLCESDGEQQ